MRTKLTILCTFWVVCLLIAPGSKSQAAGGNHLIYLPIVSRYGGWQEVGVGSAAGGGISNSAGTSFIHLLRLLQLGCHTRPGGIVAVEIVKSTSAPGMGAVGWKSGQGRPAVGASATLPGFRIIHLSRLLQMECPMWPGLIPPLGILKSTCVPGMGVVGMRWGRAQPAAEGSAITLGVRSGHPLRLLRLAHLLDLGGYHH
jgi:hypothetical protein